MNIPDILFTREHATQKMFKRAERWFNNLSVTGQLDAIYDAWVVNNEREKR
jgi:hypothetical protein